MLLPFKAAEESDDLRVIRRAEHQQEAVVLPGRLARRAAKGRLLRTDAVYLLDEGAGAVGKGEVRVARGARVQQCLGPGSHAVGADKHAHRRVFPRFPAQAGDVLGADYLHAALLQAAGIDLVVYQPPQRENAFAGRVRGDLTLDRRRCAGNAEAESGALRDDDLPAHGVSSPRAQTRSNAIRMMRSYSPGASGS